MPHPASVFEWGDILSASSGVLLDLHFSLTGLRAAETVGAELTPLPGMGDAAELWDTETSPSAGFQTGICHNPPTSQSPFKVLSLLYEVLNFHMFPS